jgi:hypothetical protein
MLEDQLRRAGVDTDMARLRTAAHDAAVRAKGNAERTMNMLMITVLSDTGLLLAALGLDKSHVRRELEELVATAVSDVQGPLRETGSQSSYDSHSRSDPRSPGASDHGGGASQCAFDSHRPNDHPTTNPSKVGAASQSRCDSRTSDDRRPVTPKPTRISRSAAAATARSSVFDVRIGAEMKLGDLTRFDVINAQRKQQVAGHVLSRLLNELRWPDDSTPLKSFCGEAQIKAIYDDGMSRLQPVPKELRHAH